jgi:hypothetical protein
MKVFSNQEIFSKVFVLTFSFIVVAIEALFTLEFMFNANYFIQIFT